MFLVVYTISSYVFIGVCSSSLLVLVFSVLFVVLSVFLVVLFHSFYFQGAIGTLLILLLFPISMLFVSCLSLFLAILSPPFIWILSAFGHFAVCLFFDFEGQVPFGGLITNILVNFIGLGTLGPMVLAFVGFIISPLVAILGKLPIVLCRLNRLWGVSPF